MKLLLIVAVSAGTAVGSHLLLTRLPRSPDDLGATTPGQRLMQMDTFGNTLVVGPDRTAVAALGRIEPEGGLIEISGQMGDQVQRLLVKTGDSVEADDELAHLESRQEHQAEVDAIAAQLEEARDGLEAETAYALAAVTTSELALEEAQRLGPTEIAVQSAKVRLAESNLETARADLARLEAIDDSHVVNQQDLDHQRQLCRQAGEQLNISQAALKLADTAHQLNLSKALAGISQARAALKRAKAAIPIRSLERKLDAAKVRLDRAIVRAPTRGRILKIESQPGESVGHQPILIMADVSTMYVVAEVYETDVSLVRKGQRATITSQALAEPVSGTIERIGMMIDKNDVLHIDPAVDADARVVETHIRLDKPELARDLTNLQVDVQIHLVRKNE